MSERFLIDWEHRVIKKHGNCTDSWPRLLNQYNQRNDSGRAEKMLRTTVPGRQKHFTEPLGSCE
jgi:hypothetical protein